MAEPAVLYESDHQIAQITLNRPENRNSMTKDVLDKARELAHEIAGCAPLAVRWTKHSVYRGLDWDPRQAAELEAHAQSRTLETEDVREGIRALLERRDPIFKGR